MSDITTIWDVANGRGDWQISGADLLNGNDLVTSTLISLFSDRRANPDDVIPDGTNDPRGWWGDAGEDYLIGSRLWLLSRRKLTQETANDARDYCAEALQWMIDDGVVANISISTEIRHPGMLGVQIIHFKNDGTQTSINFNWVWQGVS